MEKKSDAIKFDYRPVIVALCFLTVFTSLGLCSSGRSLYLTAITDALDLPRGAFSVNNTFRYVSTSVVNLFFGPLVSRFGTKKMICAGFVLLIAFALINSVATSLVAFYIGGICLGVGLAWTGTSMMSAVVNNWCTKNKSTIMGMVLAGNGIGGAVAVQILSPIIFEEGNPFGYRTSYRLVAIALAAVLVLLLIFYRNPPRQPGESDLPKKKKVRGEGWVGMDYSTAIRKPYFYLALLSTFLTGMVLQGLDGIATPHMYDVGMDVEYVAILVSLGGVLLTCTKILMGFLYDHCGIRLPMNLALVCAFLSITLLVFVDNTVLGNIFAFIRTIIGSFATPLETVLIPIFVAEFFGNKSFDRLVGLFVSASTAGFAVGSPFGNVCFDIFGNYRLAFLIFGVLMVIVAVLLWIVLRQSTKDRKAILEALALDSAEAAPDGEPAP